jgi:YVTN family beta-propeller protein
MPSVADPGRILVLNKDEHTASFLLCATGETLATLPMDRDPHEVIVTRDGRTSYVVNAVGKSIAVVDNVTMSVRETITHPEFEFPHGIDLDADGNIWLAATMANKLFVIRVSDHAFLAVIPTLQQHSHMIAFTPDRRLLYVPNIRSNTLTLVDVVSRKVLRHLLVGKGPEGVAVHPDGEHVYVAAQHEDVVQVFTTRTHELVAREAVGSMPVRLAFTPDGRYAFVPNRTSKDVSVIDARTHREIKRIPIGIWPGGVVFEPNGRYAYVANNKTNDVSVIDVAELTEVARYRAGIHPDGIAYVPAVG